MRSLLKQWFWYPHFLQVEGWRRACNGCGNRAWQDLRNAAPPVPVPCLAKFDQRPEPERSHDQVRKFQACLARVDLRSGYIFPSRKIGPDPVPCLIPAIRSYSPPHDRLELSIAMRRIAQANGWRVGTRKPCHSSRRSLIQNQHSNLRANTRVLSRLLGYNLLCSTTENSPVKFSEVYGHIWKKIQLVKISIKSKSFRLELPETKILLAVCVFLSQVQVLSPLL